MKFLVAPLLMIAFSFTQAQSSKEYVCAPCGGDCDQQIYKEPGNCKSCGMKLVEKSTVKFTNISLDEMCKRLNANPNVVLLDVRSAEEFNGTGFRTYGHFRGAININITELESRLPELEKYKNSEIIVYCSHSQRSPRASQLLTSKGFTNVKNMAGGVSAIEYLSSNECLKKFYREH